MKNVTYKGPDTKLRFMNIDFPKDTAVEVTDDIAVALTHGSVLVLIEEPAP